MLIQQWKKYLAAFFSDDDQTMMIILDGINGISSETSMKKDPIWAKGSGSA